MLTFAGVVDGDCDAEAKQSRAEQAKQSKKEGVTCNGALLCFALLCFAFALRCFAFALLCFAFAYSIARIHPRAISRMNSTIATNLLCTE